MQLPVKHIQSQLLQVATLSVLTVLMSACGGGGGNPAPGEPTTPQADLSLPATPSNLFTAENFPLTGVLAPMGTVDLGKPVAVSASALRLLTADLPELATYGPDMATAELATRATVAAQTGTPGVVTKAAAMGAQAVMPSAAMGVAPGKARAAEAGSTSAAVGAELGVVAAVLMDTFKDLSQGSVVKDTKSYQGNGAEGSVSFEAGGGTSADGTTSGVFAIGEQVKASGGGATATVGAQISMNGKGNLCPDPAGNVVFKLDFVVGAQGSVGSKTMGGTQEVSINGTAHVNDAAYISSIDYAIRVQKSEQRPESHNTFVDASFTGSLSSASATSGAGGAMSHHRNFPDLGKVRIGSTTTLGEAFNSSFDMRNAAVDAIQGYLYLLENNWRKGKCVEVIAPVPSVVGTGSSTQINASVRHKIEGVALNKPIDVSLSGAASVSPSRIENAPGTFTYVAPGEKGKTATLTFTSTSRRGIGELVASVKTDETAIWVGTFDTQISGPPLNVTFRSSGTATFERDEAATQAADPSGRKVVFKIQTGRVTVGFPSQAVGGCTLSAPTEEFPLVGKLTIDSQNNTYEGEGYTAAKLTVTEVCPHVPSMTLPIPLVLWFYPNGSQALAADGKSFTGTRTDTLAGSSMVAIYNWSFTKQ